MRKQMRQTAIRISFSCALKNAHRCAFNCSQVSVSSLTGVHFSTLRCSISSASIMLYMREESKRFQELKKQAWNDN